MLSLYRWLGYPLFFLLSFLLWPFIPKRLKESVKLKLSARYPGSASPCILIHAASGEIEYAKSVIRELTTLNLNKKILVTYSSPSFKRLFSECENILCCVLPFDFSFLINRFFKKYNVKLILVARSDLWPELARSAQKSKIPLIYFSVTQGRSRSQLSLLKSRYLKELYQLASHIYTVSEDDLNNILTFSHNSIRISVLGDTRFDQALYRVKNPKPLPPQFEFIVTQGLVLTLGSTWPEDEKNWLPILSDVLNTTHIKLILIAPHEPSAAHLNELEIQLNLKNLNVKRLSQVKTSSSTASIILIDQTGILAEVYLKSDLAFIGGSFKSKVHSVMEPLAAGLMICVGPFYHNNREAIAFSNKITLDHSLKIVTPVHSPNEILAWCSKASLSLFNKKVNASIKQEVQSLTGASRSLAMEVKKILEDL